MQTRLHPITGAPMAPIGYTRKGRAVWPVGGGAPDGDEGNTGGSGSTAGTGSTTGTGTGSAPPAGEQPTLTQSQVNALLAEERRKATERASSKYGDYEDIKAKAARFDALEAESQTTLERERNKAKAEGATEVLAKANARLVSAEVRAQAAAARFRDPLDALAHLQVSGALRDVKVDDDGNVDGAAIKTALETLAKDKAYLLESAAPPPPPTPGAAGVGAGSDSGKGTSANVQPGMGRLRSAYGKTSTKT